MMRFILLEARVSAESVSAIPTKKRGLRAWLAALFACSEGIPPCDGEPVNYFAPMIYMALLDGSAANTYVPAGKSAVNTLIGRAGTEALS
jgi:hypothetical protein